MGHTMVMLRTGALCGIFCLIFSLSIAVQAKPDKELRSLLKDLDDRFEDFYSRQNEIKRHRFERREGASQQRQWRKEQMKRRELARKSFVRPKPNIISPEQYEKEKNERRRAYEEARRHYVQNRDQLRKKKELARKIPEEIEVGLVPIDQ